MRDRGIIEKAIECKRLRNKESESIQNQKTSTIFKIQNKSIQKTVEAAKQVLKVVSNSITPILDSHREHMKNEHSNSALKLRV